ncbi:MAG: 3'(2'),5'-bisphosphate nucleotidase [Helicobacteraceae bacterium 4484_230]|nr:MAG: 3'(2'),5'-bisphosphate nucleotidase [Helicobacteraceae bacterium 4484_230]
MLNHINIQDIVSIAKEAGSAIMEIYEKDFQIEYKDDKSPLTEADLKSNEIICSALVNLYPDIPLLSEENKEVPYGDRKGWEYFWLIDPIDGTKEFIKKNGEFTVNIALIHKDVPVLGVVYAPVLNDMYYAKKGEGAFKNGLRLPLEQNSEPEKKLSVVASKSHLSKETQEFIDNLRLSTEELSLVSKGSSLKLCMVAEGAADIYPRLAPTMEWDTAAAHAVVLEAGKEVLQYQEDFLSEGAKLLPVVYNKENLLNPWFVVRG